MSVIIVTEEIDVKLFGELFGGGVEGEEELVENGGEAAEDGCEDEEGVVFRVWICTAFARGMTNWVTFS